MRTALIIAHSIAIGASASLVCVAVGSRVSAALPAGIMALNIVFLVKALLDDEA